MTPDLLVKVVDSIYSGTLIDMKSKEGNTLLHLAVRFDLEKEVAKLLYFGANIMVKNNDGLSAKDIALESANQVMIQLLNR